MKCIKGVKKNLQHVRLILFYPPLIAYFPITACLRSYSLHITLFVLLVSLEPSLLSWSLNASVIKHAVFIISKVNSGICGSLHLSVKASFLMLHLFITLDTKELKKSQKVAANKHTLLSQCLLVFSIFGWNCGLKLSLPSLSKVIRMFI